MTNIEPFEGKKAVICKNGAAHWIPVDRAVKLEELLAAATKHMFVKIDGATISSSEIEGIYTPEEFDKWSKVKQGMWQCEYSNWHNKGKPECECKKAFYAKMEQDRKKRREADGNRDLTAIEKKQAVERFRIMNEMAALSGKPGSIFRKMYQRGGSRKIRRSTVDVWEAKNGPARTDDLAIEEDIENETRAGALEILD